MSFVVISFKSCTLTRKRKPKGPAQEPHVTGFRNSLNTKAPKRWWLTLFSVLRQTWRLTHNRLIFSPASSPVHLTTHQYKHLGCRGKRPSGVGNQGLLWVAVQVYSGLKQTWPNQGAEKFLLVTHLFCRSTPHFFGELSPGLSPSPWIWRWIQMDSDKTRCAEPTQKLTLQILYKGKLYTGQADLSLSPQNHLLYPKM